MKVLLQNYSSPLSTEPMYFYRCLNHAGIATSLWSDPRTSAFDAFDMFKPDIFIGHWKFLTSDVVKYLSQNKSIQTTLNVSFATQEDIEKIDQVLDSSNVSVDFLFTNQHEALYKLKSKYKLVNIVPAADVFIPTDSSLKDWKNECAILSTTPHKMFLEACKNQEVYHKLCFGTQSDAFDISVDIQSLPSLVPNYKSFYS